MDLTPSDIINYYQSESFADLYSPSAQTKILKRIIKKGSPAELLQLVKYFDGQRGQLPKEGADSGVINVNLKMVLNVDD